MVIGETIGWKCPATELPKIRSVLSWSALFQMRRWQRPNETESLITVDELQRMLRHDAIDVIDTMRPLAGDVAHH